MQGGSTITQQVAKNLFLTNARTLRRKVQELMLTLWLEHTFSKREILEIWLNRVYLGSGAWGMDAAARMYFGISARKVTLWQAAVLAGLPRAPSRFNPRSRSRRRRRTGAEVLAAMVETGAITAEQARAGGGADRFPPRRRWPPAGSPTGWPSRRSRCCPAGRRHAAHHARCAPAGGGRSRLAALLDGPGAAAGASQGAVVVLDAATGAVRAMVGGRDYRPAPINRAVLARRQPGSAFKPFVWLAALETGMRPDDPRAGRADPHRRLESRPNFERRYPGEITLEEALAQSINTVSVRLLLQAGGPRAVAARRARLGIADSCRTTHRWRSAPARSGCWK